MIYVQHIDPLNMQGDLVAEWTRFADQWNSYERQFPQLATMSSKRRAAIFLSWVGSDAFLFCRKNMFEREEDRYDFDKLVAAFQRHCLGEENARRYIGAVTRPVEVIGIEPAPVRSASQQRDHQNGRRNAVESVAEPSLTMEDKSTGGAPTAAAAVDDIDDATAPVEVNESPSAPEASASQRADHPAECKVRRLPPISVVEQPYRRWEIDDDASVDAASAATIVGPGDACAASAATEPPWNESREDEIATSPAVTSVWPSSAAVEQPYRRREHDDDDASMDAASALTIAEPIDASAARIAAEPPWKEPRREDQVASLPAWAIAFPPVPMTSATRPMDQGDNRCGVLSARPSDEDRTIYVGARRSDTERQRPVTEPTTDPTSETTVDNLNFMLRATPPPATLSSVVRLGVLSDADRINSLGNAAEATSHQQNAHWTAVMPSERIAASDLCIVAALERAVTENDFTIFPRGATDKRHRETTTPSRPAAADHPSSQRAPPECSLMSRRRGQRPGQRRTDAHPRHRLNSRPLRVLINRSALDRLLRLQSSLEMTPGAVETAANFNRCGETLRRLKGSMSLSGQLDTLLTWLHAPG
jgi:hypothetical protein